MANPMRRPLPHKGEWQRSAGKGHFVMTLILVLLSIFLFAFPDGAILGVPVSTFSLLLSIVPLVLFDVLAINIPVQFGVAVLAYLSFLLIPAFFVRELGFLLSYYLYTGQAFLGYFLTRVLAQRLDPDRVRRLVLLVIVLTGSVMSIQTLGPILLDLSKVSHILTIRAVGVGSLVSNDLATFVAVSLVCTLGLVLTMPRGRLLLTTLGLIVGAVQVIALLATGSRGGMLAFLGGALVLSWLLRSKRIALGLGAVIAVSVAVTVGLVPEIAQSFLGRVQAGSASGRFELWLSALETFVSSPLFGVGMGNFVSTQSGRESLWLAHNIIIQQLLNGGILATVAFAWIWFLVYRDARLGLQSCTTPAGARNNYLALVAALVTLWIHSMLEPVLGTPRGDMLAWVIAGLLTRPRSQSMKSSSNS